MTAAKPLEALAMPCPACGRLHVLPLPESTLTIAWYVCPCSHFWSARIRDGRPVASTTPDTPPPPRRPTV